LPLLKHTTLIPGLHLRGEPAHLPNPGPVDKEENGHGDETDTDEPEDTSGPSDAQISVHVYRLRGTVSSRVTQDTLRMSRDLPNMGKPAPNSDRMMVLPAIAELLNILYTSMM